MSRRECNTDRVIKEEAKGTRKRQRQRNCGMNTKTIKEYCAVRTVKNCMQC